MPEKYFSPGQYDTADSGFAISSYMMIPYRQPYASLPHNQAFNQLFSSARVTIEHVNGLLKARFSSLRGVRVQIKKKQDFKLFCQHVVVCLILHNIMLAFNDTQFDYELEEDRDDDDDDDDDDEGSRLEQLDLNLSPVDFRTKLQEYMLKWLGY